MSGVDVLAVMDRAHRVADPQRFHAREDLHDARAAVAELIEADRELDAANLSLHLAGDLPAAGRVAAFDRVIAAGDRRRTALARVGGAP